MSSSRPQIGAARSSARAMKSCPMPPASGTSSEAPDRDSHFARGCSARSRGARSTSWTDALLVGAWVAFAVALAARAALAAEAAFCTRLPLLPP